MTTTEDNERAHGSVVEQVHRVITTDQGVDPWVLAEEIVKFVRKRRPVPATEDNEARGAVEAIADGILRNHILFGDLHGAAVELSRCQIINVLRDGLSALSDAGYTVVKTEWEYDYAFAKAEGRAPQRRRFHYSPWEPVHLGGQR